MILHSLRMRRNVNRNVFNDREKCKRDTVANSASWAWTETAAAAGGRRGGIFRTSPADLLARISSIEGLQVYILVQ